MDSSKTFSTLANARGRGIPFLGRGRRGLARDSRGAAALEFGILLPFLVILLSGVVELGRSLWQHHALDKGVRDAARYLSRVPDPTDAGARARAKNIATRGHVLGTEPLLFSHWQTSFSTNLDSGTNLVQPFDNTGCTFRGPCTNGGVSVINVTADVTPPASEFPLLSLIGIGAIQYSARAQMRHLRE